MTRKPAFDAFLDSRQVLDDRLVEVARRLARLTPAQLDRLDAVLAAVERAGAMPAAPVRRPRLGYDLPPVDIKGRPWPAAPYCAVRDSVQPGHLVCLLNGRKVRMLKPHLRVEFGLTVRQYLQMYGLPADYPTTAPDYAAAKRAHAAKLGLGAGMKAMAEADRKRRMREVARGVKKPSG